MSQKLRLVFADTETSGLAESVEEAIQLDRQVIEYAFVVWEEGQILKRFERKVMPTGAALDDAKECARNGWNHFDEKNWWRSLGPATREYEQAKPWGADDCGMVEDFLGGETLAGSNPRFDLTMFKAEFARLGALNLFPKLATHRMMNTGDLAWLLWSARLVEKTGLETLTKFLGIEHKAHTAMGDCLACVSVFETLCDVHVSGPRKLRDLLLALIDCLPDKVDQAFARAELAKVRVL